MDPHSTDLPPHILEYAHDWHAAAQTTDCPACGEPAGEFCMFEAVTLPSGRVIPAWRGGNGSGHSARHIAHYQTVRAQFVADVEGFVADVEAWLSREGA